LLPRETVTLVHVPDFQSQPGTNGIRPTFTNSIRKPASAGIFEIKPLSRVPQRDSTSQTSGRQSSSSLRKMRFWPSLRSKTTIRILPAVSNFAGANPTAEKIIERWRIATRTRCFDARNRRLRTAQDRHCGSGAEPGCFRFTTDNGFFCFYTISRKLKGVVDRTDGRAKDTQTTLDADEALPRGDDSYADRVMRCFFMVTQRGLRKNWQRSVTRLARPGSLRMLSIKFIALPGRLVSRTAKCETFLCLLGCPKTQPERKLTRSSLDLGHAGNIFVSRDVS